MQPPALIALSDGITPNMYLIESEITVMGRAEEVCHIVVPDKRVSKIQATIRRDKMVYYYLEDANSTNGTYVNRQRVREPRLLKDQDVIGFWPGHKGIRFEDSETTTPVVPRLRYDPNKKKFYVNEQLLKLTQQEYNLFYFLYQHLGILCDYQACTEAVWEDIQEGDDRQDDLYRLVNRIKNKLADARDILVNDPGFGYYLDL